MGLPIVSIIIPVYNVEKYIEKCLNSVLNQTLKDIEIICINDGSTDNSLMILKEFAKKDKRIVLINQENKGQSESRNLGISIAKGEYIAFLDSDDWVEKDFYEKLYNQAIAEGDDIVCSETIYYQKGNFERNNFVSKKIHKAYKKRNTDYELFQQIGASVIWNKIYKKSIFSDKNIYFPNLPRFEDNYFTFAVFSTKPKIGYCLDTAIYYRIRENSVMTSIVEGDEKYFDILKVVEEIDRLAIKKNFEGEKIFSEIADEFKMTMLIGWAKKSRDNKFVKSALEIVEKIDLNKNSFISRKLKNRFHKLKGDTFFQRIFSINKNIDKRHTVFKILGFTIKIRPKEIKEFDYIENSKNENENILLTTDNFKVPLSTKKNKMLVIFDYFLEKGGVETRLYKYLNFLTKKGWEVYLLSESNKNKGLLEFNNFYLNFNSKNFSSCLIELINRYGITNLEFHFGSDKFLKNIDFNNIDKKIKIGSVIHNRGVRSSKILNRFVYNIVVSDRLKQNFYKKLKNVAIIGNGIEKREPIWGYSNQNKAIIISRIDEEKLPTIEAFIQYCQGYGFDFDIAGNDESAGVLTDLLVKKYGITVDKFIGNVKTIEFLTDNKDEYLFVGGVGQVIIEAGVLGYPVLCSSHRGVEYSSFVTDENFEDFPNFTIISEFKYKQIKALNFKELQKYSINSLICKNLDIEGKFEKYYEILNN